MTEKYWNTHEPEELDFPIVLASGYVEDDMGDCNFDSCGFCQHINTDPRTEPCLNCHGESKKKTVGWLPAREIAAAIKYRTESEDER